MRRDRDCPYKAHCNSAPEGCEECDWHLAFEKFRRRIEKLENRLSRANATLEIYRGVKGCRLNEMMDAEIQGRCLTVPKHTSTDIGAFRAYYREFALRLCTDKPSEGVKDIALAISNFLGRMEMETVVREANEKEGGHDK